MVLTRQIVNNRMIGSIGKLDRYSEHVDLKQDC